MKLKVTVIGLLVTLLLVLSVFPSLVVEAVTSSPPETTEDSITTATMSDGTEIVAVEILSPPEPPSEYAEERAASMVSSLNRATTLSNFPSYDWVFGCSAVSAAMIAAYYDNNGYADMYTGPANGGVMPISDTYWEGWRDSFNNWYPNNPLVASHAGVDGRGLSVLGSIDDYWYRYRSDNVVENDPYITGSWTPHTWGTAVGDYMKTSQSDYSNADGGTTFWYQPGSGEKLYCSELFSAGSSIYAKSGTYGRKLFYETRGYTVTECYNQNTDNFVASGGFTLTDFQAEIDAGNPVLLNLEGHSIVGFGYSGSTIYIRDTWDSDPNHIYSMAWGGSYSGMELYSVSIVHLAPAAPTSFGKSSPHDGAVQWPNLTLTWESSIGADEYEYCYYLSGGSCSSWTSVGTSTSVELNGLSVNTTYEWQVRATNSEGTTYADGSSAADWSFTTLDPADFTEINFLPFVLK